MKLTHDSASCLLHLLLLAELFDRSSSRPAHSLSLCGLFGSMIPQVERLKNFSRKLHDLSDEDLLSFADVESRLHTLPHLHEITAADFTLAKVNESLSQLYSYTRSFELHLNWLKAAQHNFSLPLQSAEGASAHLLQLSNLMNTSLHQMNEEAPLSASPSLPVVSSAFDVLHFSVEISERLQIFCNWSKRVLRHVQRLMRCPRR